MAKLAAMGRQGVYVVSRPLRYRNQTVRLLDGTERTVLVGEEKGIDVRIALDVIRLAHRREYDVAVVLSQDQDLAEVAARLPQGLTRSRRRDRVSVCDRRAPPCHTRRGRYAAARHRAGAGVAWP